ncbi:S-layer homology domain-containing protein [Sporosarcina sp. FA9]|uniref:S-layer homology domain-containing protein n=1 Tax=Sporosarcina sp. FA9 TaxID=3413030 RepID=UPI003F65C7E7
MRKSAILLSFVLLLNLLPISFVKADANFPDVFQYEQEISYLTNKNIIRGFPDGTFGPTKSLTRLQAVQMLLKSKNITDFAAPNPMLTDMTIGKYGYEEVAKAVELGIISGKTAKDGTKYFDPGSPLTRGQMAKIIVEAGKLPKKNASYFTDVLPSNGFHDYISTLAEERITGGYEDGTYRPNLNVTRQHFAVFVARMLDEKFKPDKQGTDKNYLLNKKMVYTWTYYDEGKSFVSTTRYTNLKYDGVLGADLWKETSGDGAAYYLVKEDETGLYEYSCVDIGTISCDLKQDPYVALEYPLIEGKVWGSLESKHDPTVYTVVSTNRTVTTKAGIFKNVVEVKDSSGWFYFYAPNVGLVKTVDNGTLFSELVKLEVNR